MAPETSSATNGVCFQAKVTTHAVLRQERAHQLARNDERDEQRPAIQPAQHGDDARMLAQHQIAADRDRADPDHRRRQRDDHHGEQDVAGVELERLGEIAERPGAVLVDERRHQREAERVDEQRQQDQQGRRDQRKRDQPRLRHPCSNAPCGSCNNGMAQRRSRSQRTLV
jgi:hypothetical protein